MKKKITLLVTGIAFTLFVGCQNVIINDAPTATSTPMPTATSTPIPTATSTPVPTATSTPMPTATSTPVPTATSTPVPTATSTPMPTATSTPVPTATSTPVPTATSTPVPTATSTPIPTPTKAPSITASETNLVFKNNEPQTIIIKVDNCKSLSLKRNYIDEKVASSEFGEWLEDGVSIPVTITPEFNGTMSIKYSVTKKNSDKVLASVIVNVTVDVENFVEIPQLKEGETIAASHSELIITSKEPHYIYFVTNENLEHLTIYHDMSYVNVEAKVISGNLVEVKVQTDRNEDRELTIKNSITDEVLLRIPMYAQMPPTNLFVSSKTVPLEEAYVGATVIMGSYEQDNDKSNGTEEIEWLVLEVKDGKALLISKYGILTGLWKACTKFTVFDGTPIKQLDIIDGEWQWFEYSENSIFYNAAFSDEEQEKICPADLENGETVHVFMLSKEEVEQYFDDDFLAEEYGNSELKKATQPTAYVKAQGIPIETYYEECMGNSLWWLRNTSGDAEKTNECVGTAGDLGKRVMEEQWIGGGTNGNNLVIDKGYPDYELMVRPAMWVEIE